jgi:hypothetical protein
LKIPMSDNAVSRRMQDISQDDEWSHNWH